MAPEPWTGTDADLDDILIDVYTCSRDWVAWDHRTMTRDDFEPAAEGDVYTDLIAWRDAAVAAERERLHPTACQTSGAQYHTGITGTTATAYVEFGREFAMTEAGAAEIAGRMHDGLEWALAPLWAKQAARPARGRCGTCGYRARLRADGTVMAHRFDSPCDPRHGQQCPGAGDPPQPDEKEATSDD